MTLLWGIGYIPSEDTWEPEHDFLAGEMLSAYDKSKSNLKKRRLRDSRGRYVNRQKMDEGPEDSEDSEDSKGQNALEVPEASKAAGNESDSSINNENDNDNKSDTTKKNDRNRKAFKVPWLLPALEMPPMLQTNVPIDVAIQEGYDTLINFMHAFHPLGEYIRFVRMAILIFPMNVFPPFSDRIVKRGCIPVFYTWLERSRRTVIGLTTDGVVSAIQIHQEVIEVVSQLLLRIYTAGSLASLKSEPRLEASVLHIITHSTSSSTKSTWKALLPVLQCV